MIILSGFEYVIPRLHFQWLWLTFINLSLVIVMENCFLDIGPYKKSKDLISLLIALINSELLIEFSELLSVHCPQVVSKVKHKALDINIYIVNIINFI